MNYEAETEDRHLVIGDRFRVDRWTIDRTTSAISDDRSEQKVSPKAMDLLVCLAQRQGQAVSKDEIFAVVWPDTFVGDEVLWKRISELRSAFGDDPKKPNIIETLPKKGYRLTAEVKAIEKKIRGEESRSKPARGLGRPILILTAVTTIILLLGAFWLVTLSPDSDRPQFLVDSGRMPVILVADIKNETGEERLGDRLRYSLEQHLTNTGLVKVVSKVRINDTLRLMRLPPETPLDEERALQIGLRDGRIDILILARIDPLKKGFQIGLRSMSLPSSEIEGATQLTATSMEQSQGQAASMAQWILNELDISTTVDPYNPSARRVSTRSLEAYGFYLGAVEAIYSDAPEKVEPLARKAIEIDPEFASAHRLRAEALMMHGEAREAMKALQKATELQDQASVPETAYIQALSHEWRGEDIEASAHYELLLDLQPDHIWALFNLLRLYRRLGRWDRIQPLLTNYVDSSPSNPGSHSLAAALLIESTGNADLASSWVKRSRELLREVSLEAIDPGGTTSAYVKSFRVWELWLANDISGAVREANRVRDWLYEHKTEVINGPRHAAFLGHMYLALGKVKEAEELFATFKSFNIHFPEFLALYRGNATEEEISHNVTLLKYPPAEELRVSGDGFDLSGQIRRRAGLLVLLRLGSSLVRNTAQQKESQSWKALIEGVEAFQRGNYSEAITGFEEAIETMRVGSVWNLTPIMITRLELARAYEREGQTSQAIEILESVSSKRSNSYGAPVPLWILGQVQLAELYRKDGQWQKSQEVEKLLDHLLQYADPGILKHLRELS